jgi:hypothetical protein
MKIFFLCFVHFCILLSDVTSPANELVGGLVGCDVVES